MNVILALFSSSTHHFISPNFNILIKTSFHCFKELLFGDLKDLCTSTEKTEQSTSTESAEHCLPPTFTFLCAAFLGPLYRLCVSDRGALANLEAPRHKEPLRKHIWKRERNVYYVEFLLYLPRTLAVPWIDSQRKERDFCFYLCLLLSYWTNPFISPFFLFSSDIFLICPICLEHDCLSWLFTFLPYSKWLCTELLED